MHARDMQGDRAEGCTCIEPDKGNHGCSAQHAENSLVESIQMRECRAQRGRAPSRVVWAINP